MGWICSTGRPEHEVCTNVNHRVNEQNIEIYLKENARGNVDWIYLADGRVCWRGFVTVVTDLAAPHEERNASNRTITE
jgi:hypothetical protein